MDPGNFLDTGTQVLFWGSMANSLTEVDAKGNIVGGLAAGAQRDRAELGRPTA
jgi:hypothetical protein